MTHHLVATDEAEGVEIVNADGEMLRRFDGVRYTYREDDGTKTYRIFEQRPSGLRFVLEHHDSER